MDNEIKTGDQNRWDLTVMYKSISDPQIDEDLKTLGEKAKKFNLDYKGQLATKLGSALTDYAEIDILSNKVMVYLFLNQSTDVANPIIKAKMAEAQRMLSLWAGEYLTFFELEIVAMDDATLEALYEKDPVVAKHRPWLTHNRIFKPHVLTEEVESALVKRSPFGASSWSEFFEEAETDLEFEYADKKYTITEILNILTESKDANERAAVLKIINDGISGHFVKYSAQTLYMVVGSKNIEDRERKYAHAMSASNMSNRIPDEVVDALHRAVTDIAGPLVKRYYRLKAKHLGLPILKWSDRNAPMPFADGITVPFEEAQKIVLAAYESFSPTLAGIVKKMFDDRRIDVPPMKGKQSGAYNYPTMLSAEKPASFVFLNYLGSDRDVMTLAHELGHGVHGILAGEAQGALMQQAPMAYAETASVFGEMTTFNFLRARLAKEGDVKSQLALLMGKIDDAMNTVVRQIGFSNFERRLHGMDASYKIWNEPKKLSVEETDEIWLQTAKELYGQDGEVFTYENASHLWSYVWHFHRPFYVYSYAFGELLTQSLYAEKDRLGDKFEPLYLDLLRSGSTRNVVELMAPFGLDPKNEKFWENGIMVGMGALIAEAEKLSAEMGVV